MNEIEKKDQLTPEQIAEGLNKSQAEIEKRIKALEEAKGDTAKFDEEFKMLKSEFEANKKELESLVNAAKAQGEKINELMQKQNEDLPVEFKRELKKVLSEKADELKVLKETRSGNVVFELKAASNMTTSNLSPTSYSINRTHEPGLTDILGINPMFESYCNVTETNSAKITYAEKKNRDGSTLFISEAASKNQIDFDIVEAESSARKVADYIKVSDEMLEDIPFIQSEIESELMYQINLAVSNGILSGNGVAPNLNGLTTIYAQSYGLATVLTTTPNIYDCIKAMVTQVIVNNGTPTHVFMNPVDYVNMNIAKGTTGHYVVVDGMVQMIPYTIIQSNQIDAGSILVSDMSKVKVHSYKGLRIEVGFENDDFTKNMVTIRGERRVHHYVKSNHTPCIVYDAIADVQAAITTP